MNRSQQIDFLNKTSYYLFIYSPKQPPDYETPEEMADDLIKQWQFPEWATVEDINMVRKNLIERAKGW